MRRNSPGFFCGSVADSGIVAGAVAVVGLLDVTAFRSLSLLLSGIVAPTCGSSGSENVDIAFGLNSVVMPFASVAFLMSVIFLESMGLAVSGAARLDRFRRLVRDLAIRLRRGRGMCVRSIRVKTSPDLKVLDLHLVRAVGLLVPDLES